MRAPRSWLFAGVAGASIAMLPGCLISGGSHKSASGTYVGRTALNQIEVGQTTGDWVRGVLGEPNTISVLDDDSQIWRWDWSRKSRSHARVFLLFGGSSSVDSSGSAWVQVRDGVVVQKGRDDSSGR
jgi:outer membrane protein assembly factor BamE (lipoprotein component of BamABCDE complex)